MLSAFRPDICGPTLFLMGGRWNFRGWPYHPLATSMAVRVSRYCACIGNRKKRTEWGTSLWITIIAIPGKRLFVLSLLPLDRLFFNRKLLARLCARPKSPILYSAAPPPTVEHAIGLRPAQDRLFGLWIIHNEIGNSPWKRLTHKPEYWIITPKSRSGYRSCAGSR